MSKNSLSSMHVNSSSSSKTYWNPQVPGQNNENPPIQANNNLPVQAPLGNPRPDNANPIHAENIHRISNTVTGNRPIVSWSSGEGNFRQDRVIRRTRPRAPWQNMYQPRHQPVENPCKCIEKTVMDGPIMPSLRTCPVHDSYGLANLPMLAPLPPPLPPVGQYWMYGSVPGHQCVGGLVPAPWNPIIQEGLDLQRLQGRNIASIFDWDWNAAQQPIGSSSFLVPETPNPEIETMNLPHFNLESHSQGTGTASNSGSRSLVHGQSIQISIPTISSPILSTTKVTLNDEIHGITQQADNRPRGNLDAGEGEELEMLIYRDPLQKGCNNKVLLKTSPSIPSSSSGHGLTNCQCTTSKRTNTIVDAGNKHAEEVEANRGSPEQNDVVGFGVETVNKMHLEVESRDEFLGGDEFLDLTNWPDHQLMGSKDEFDI